MRFVDLFKEKSLRSFKNVILRSGLSRSGFYANDTIKLAFDKAALKNGGLLINIDLLDCLLMITF